MIAIAPVYGQDTSRMAFQGLELAIFLKGKGAPEQEHVSSGDPTHREQKTNHHNR
jgi:hypothetical protein